MLPSPKRSTATCLRRAAERSAFETHFIGKIIFWKFELESTYNYKKLDALEEALEEMAGELHGEKVAHRAWHLMHLQIGGGQMAVYVLSAHRKTVR